MKYIDEYRDPDLARKIVASIKHISTKPANIMEFCGGHTNAIMRNGIRQLLPANIRMLSGPGCPVCVSSNADIDKAIALANLPGVIVTTFGDMIRVPGSYSNLQQARAGGADIRIVYSPQDAVRIAEKNPSKSIVFIAVGFETTAPGIASSILEAQSLKLTNYYVLSLLKNTPAVIKAVLELGEVKIDGILGPGHVCAVLGSVPFEFIARDYGIPFVISGFEPVDIIASINNIILQIEEGKAEVGIAYKRGVKSGGNKKAREIMHTVFEAGNAEWRGIGSIPSSGFKLSAGYRQFDAIVHFNPKVPPPREAAGCICGEVLRAIKTPDQCKLFRKVCMPESPVGPCMVSSEGTCAAYYSYGDKL